MNAKCPSCAQKAARADAARRDGLPTAHVKVGEMVKKGDGQWACNECTLVYRQDADA